MAATLNSKTGLGRVVDDPDITPILASALPAGITCKCFACGVPGLVLGSRLVVSYQCPYREGSPSGGHVASAHVQRPATHAPAAGRKTCAYVRPGSGLLYHALLVNTMKAAPQWDSNKKACSPPLRAAGRFLY